MKKIYVRKKLPVGKLCRFELFSFKAVAAGAAFRIAAAGVADVDFSQGTIIACAVVLAFGHAATDCGIYFFVHFVHHNKNPPFG
jgi:hypothetical protein